VIHYDDISKLTKPIRERQTTMLCQTKLE